MFAALSEEEEINPIELDEASDDLHHAFEQRLMVGCGREQPCDLFAPCRLLCGLRSVRFGGDRRRLHRQIEYGHRALQRYRPCGQPHWVPPLAAEESWSEAPF